MDSLSQIVLGGAVAAACVPAPHRRAALLAGALVLSDLRMGLERAYTFNFAVAARADGRWRPIAPQAVPAGEGGMSPGGLGPAWRAIWRRIWHEPG